MMRIAFLGDVALIGKYDIENNNFENIKNHLKEVKNYLDDCDCVVGNLETPFTRIKNTKEAKTLPLRTNEFNVRILEYLGVDAVSLSNNHFFDYGNVGANECIEILNKSNIEYFGIDGKSFIYNYNNQKIKVGGFCCHTTNAWYFDDMDYSNRHVLNTLSLDNINTFLNNNKDEYPILYIHWGEENTHYPKKEHIEFANQVLNEHKATIIGHHPHVIQGIKNYKQGKSFFSLGNFCFDDCKSTKSKVEVKQILDNLKGYFVVMDINEDNTINYEIVPYRDTQKGLIIDYGIQKEIKKYSDEIENVTDWLSYENKRQNEQQNAFSKRLGKRNIHWLLGHMNKSAFQAVKQRKINNKKFKDNILKLNKKYCYNDIKNHKKCILYVGNFDRPDKSAAGKRVFGNAKILESLEYEVFLIGKEKKYEDRVKYSNNINFYSFPRYKIFEYKKYVSWINQFINKKGIKPVAIIRYGSPSIALFDFSLQKWCRLNNIKIIADVVDWLSPDGGNIVFNLIKSIDTFFEKVVFNKMCDGIIVISSYLLRYYKNYKEKIIVLPPLIEKTNENNSENEYLKLIYAGNPFRKGVQVKNTSKIKDRLDLCVLSINELSKTYKIKFDIFGLTKEEYLLAFPNQILEANNECITFHGMKPMKKVQNQIQKSDFSILLRECSRTTMAGFPTKIVESISCGTPVITTDTSDLNKYIKSGENGFFVSINDLNILSKQIGKIASLSLNEKKRMKKQCANNINFVYLNYKNQMSEFLKKI